MARPLTVAPEWYLYEYTKRITIQQYIFTSIFPVFRAMIDYKSYMHDFLDVAVKKMIIHFTDKTAFISIM